MRAPQINCLWIGAVKKISDKAAQQWLRVITTMSLTHSDGYVSFSNGAGGPRYEWHEFWSADLGQPLTGKAIIHKDTQGFFTRTFTNGIGAYNRSNNNQDMVFTESVISVAIGKKGTTQSIEKMDGDIFLYYDYENPSFNVNLNWAEVKDIVNGNQ